MIERDRSRERDHEPGVHLGAWRSAASVLLHAGRFDELVLLYQRAADAGNPEAALQAG